MNATPRDPGGETTAIQPATADSYGVRPPDFRLPPSTRIHSVTLQVSDLARSREFYEHTLGFRVLGQSASRLMLGAHGSEEPLIELRERRGASTSMRRKSLGLYHVAILLPTRAALGRFLRHLGQHGVRAGAGDHFVSEALYLQDPDDLGIEVYADRPQAAWTRRGRELVMGTDALDMRDLMAAGGSDPWSGMPAGTTIGHVHLHVGDIDTGSRFYADAVGFDRMVWSYPGALFMAAGGYHHHLGTNIWAGAGAQPAAADDPQLLEWTIHVPTRDAVAAAAASIANAGHVAESADGDASIVTRDPWGTALRIAVATP